MNIFIIPSWYPTTKVPLNGIFIKEQAMAFAKFRPDCNVIIAKWDSGYTFVTPRKPFLAFVSLINLQWGALRDTQVTSNFFEFYSSVGLVWSQKLPFGGIKGICNSIKKSFLRAQKQFGNIDILHAHVSYPAGYIAAMLSQEFGIPYVLTEHMGPFPFDNLLINNKPIPEIYRAFESARETIAVSNSLRKKIRSFNLPCGEVVQNYINESKFHPSDLKNKKFTFFTLCSISKQKGIDTLLSSISLLSPYFRERIDFIIGGIGTDLEKYKKIAESFSIKNVKWIGHVDRDEAPKIFQISHAYIMLSRHETFGIVYAEAIASGIPVIATRCGGAEDIVNSMNGILVDLESPEQAKEAIIYLYENYTDFDQKKIRQDFESRFSTKYFVEKLGNIYNRALSP